MVSPFTRTPEKVELFTPFTCKAVEVMLWQLIDDAEVNAPDNVVVPATLNEPPTDAFIIAILILILYNEVF